MSGTTYRVALEPDGEEFSVEAGEPILNAALRQGVPLRYGCRHGNCSSCKYLLLDGDVDLGNASPYSLSESEREQGWALLCCATALDDLVIRDERVPDERAKPVIPPAEIAARVAAVEPLTRSLWRLALALETPLTFYAGQFVEIEIPGRPGEWRSYSIASAPSRGAELEFVVKRIEAGAFSSSIDRLSPGSPIRLRGPYGTGYLRDGVSPVALVATGSGIAPILSILRDAADHGDSRAFTFFYGARTRADLVFLAELERLASVLRGFRFEPTLSRPTEACDWRGVTGRVTQAIQRGIEDSSGFDNYLCGAPEMCETVALLLAAKGALEERIFFDKFYPASEATPAGEGTRLRAAG